MRDALKPYGRNEADLNRRSGQRLCEHLDRKLNGGTTSTRQVTKVVGSNQPNRTGRIDQPEHELDAGRRFVGVGWRRTRTRANRSTPPGAQPR
jgi:hypothetical protein